MIGHTFKANYQWSFKTHKEAKEFVSKIPVRVTKVVDKLEITYKSNYEAYFVSLSICMSYCLTASINNELIRITEEEIKKDMEKEKKDNG